MQVKLLRVIQEKTIRPVGQANEVAVDVRILSATHKNLGELVAEGSFREDLYYRINVIGLQRAAAARARRRRADARASRADAPRRRAGRADAAPDARGAGGAARLPIPRQRPRAREHPRARADAVLGRGDRRRGLAAARRRPRRGAPRSGTDRGAPLGTQLEEIERDAIVAALEQTRYNKTAAAKLLGLTFRALRYRIKKLGIE